MLIKGSCDGKITLKTKTFTDDINEQIELGKQLLNSNKSIYDEKMISTIMGWRPNKAYWWKNN